jgi:hypothetical protein
MDQEGRCDCRNLPSYLKIPRIIYNVVINDCKKGRTQIFPPSSFFVLIGSGDPRSGMEEKPGYGINIPDPQYC